MPAGAGQDPLRAPARLPRHRRALRPDRRVLRPPRRLALVWPQRGSGAALPLPRLEIRCDRPVYRCSFRAARVGLLPEDQAEILSAGETRPGAVVLYAPA